MIVRASLAVIDLISETTELRDKLEANTKRFRERMIEAGFDITPPHPPLAKGGRGDVHPPITKGGQGGVVPLVDGGQREVHPIVPIMLYNAKLSQDFARDLYDEGIYVIGFYHPVVPKGLARIRVQLSAAHEFSHIDRAVSAFTTVGRKYEILATSKAQIIERYGE